MSDNNQVQLPACIESVAIGPGGNLGAVALRGGQLALFNLSGGALEPKETFALPRDRGQDVEGARISVLEPRLAFLDERTILVARAVHRHAPDEAIPVDRRFCTSLLALDAATADPRGEFEIKGGLSLLVSPLPIGPHHVLLSLVGKTLICVDTFSWREVCRVRQLDDDYDPVGDGSEDADECLAANGVAFDRERGLLYVLWQFFNAGLVQTYRFEPEAPRFVGVARSPAITDSNAGYSASGLCLRPDGSAVAGWFPIFDALIDCRASGSEEPPKTTLIGKLRVFSGDTRRDFNVESEMARDLLVQRHVMHEPDGSEYFFGYRVGVDECEARPFFLDNRRVLLNTPGGFLLGIDTESGQTEVLHDVRTPIRSLDFHRATRRLLVGGEDQSLRLLEV